MGEKIQLAAEQSTGDFASPGTGTGSCADMDRQNYREAAVCRDARSCGQRYHTLGSSTSVHGVVFGRERKWTDSRFIAFNYLIYIWRQHQLANWDSPCRAHVTALAVPAPNCFQ